MAKRDSTLVRLKNTSIEGLLTPIIEQEKKRGRKTSYAEAMEILRFRINKVGGLNK